MLTPHNDRRHISVWAGFETGIARMLVPSSTTMPQVPTTIKPIVNLKPDCHNVHLQYFVCIHHWDYWGKTTAIPNINSENLHMAGILK